MSNPGYCPDCEENGWACRCGREPLPTAAPVTDHSPERALAVSKRCADLAKQTPVAGEPDPLWWERQAALGDAADKINELVALTPPEGDTVSDEVAERVALAECPIGLFWSQSGELCLKTEYGNNEGRIDAYIVSSGEFFWGAAPQTIASQRAQLVTPIDTDAALKALTPPEGDTLSGEAVEVIEALDGLKTKGPSQ